VIGLVDVAEERINRDFRERLQILRLHSGSIRNAPMKPRPAPADTTRPAAPGSTK
jgi:hypothetical protein